MLLVAVLETVLLAKKKPPCLIERKAQKFSQMVLRSAVLYAE